MYRTDRFVRIDHPDRGPILITITALSVLAVAFACVARSDKKVDTQVTSPAPAAAPKLAVAGEVADSQHAPQIVTFGDAQAAYNKRHYREATESFDSYVQTHPNNGFGFYMLGLSAWKSGDLVRARDAFEHSLTLDSTNVKTLLNLGRVLLDQGKPNEALERIDAAVRLDSGSAEVYRMMARVQAALGQGDSAEASYRVALSIDPTDSWSMNNLGLLLIDQGRYDEALPPLARAVELRPDAPAFANNLGVALERTGHAGAAAEAYRAALKADSTYSKASTSLARVEATSDSSTDLVDVAMLASAYKQQLESERQTRVAKGVVKPDRIEDPQR
jgi:Tfp pilus assembly protein PilF